MGKTFFIFTFWFLSDQLITIAWAVPFKFHYIPPFKHVRGDYRVSRELSVLSLVYLSRVIY